MYRPQRFQILPPVIKNLLIINGLMFLATIVLQSSFGIDMIRLMGIHFPLSPEFRPFQIITHMFMHGSFTHILFNMFALWMFGAALENLWGSRKFLIYYLITGLGAAVLHEAVMYIEYLSLVSNIQPDHLELMLNGVKSISGVSPGSAYGNELRQMYSLLYTPTVGASGAVFGILLGFGMTYPNAPIFIYFLFPIKAKYFVMIYGALELWNGLANAASPVAHFAHLGGMLFGFILIKLWQRRRNY